MLKIWRGLGFVVAVGTAGCLFGAYLLTNQFAGDVYWSRHGWPFAVAMAAAAGMCWLLGRRLNKPARKDAESPRSWTHDFLFVRMERWAYPLAALALVVVFTGWKPGNPPKSVKAAANQAQRLVK